MNRWPTQPLGELLMTLENGSRPKGGATELCDGIPSLGGEHITREGGFVWETPKHVSRDFFAGMKRGRIQQGDILVVKDGATTGKTAMVREHFPFRVAAINEHVFLLRTDKTKVLPEFAGYFLFSPVGQKQILSNFRGAAIGGIAQDFVRNVHVPLPPLADQARIVKLLDEADELRKLRIQADHRTATLIPALFHEMFGDTIKKHCRWTMERFGELLAEPLRNGQSPAKDGRFRAKVFTLSAITGEMFDKMAWKEALFAREPEESCRVSENIFLICRGNGNRELVGCGKFPRGVSESIVFPDTMIAATLKPERLLPEYLDAAWRQPTTRSQIHSGARTTNGTFKINQTVLENISLPVPPLVLQKEFAERVREIRAIETAQATSRTRLDALFQSMLHRAFNGEL